MNDDELIAWIRLNLSLYLGKISFNKLMEKYNDINYILSNFSRLQKLGEISTKAFLCSEIKAKNYLKNLAKYDAKILTSNSSLYPKNLRIIYDYPPILYYRGNIKLLKNYEKTIAIVGSRRPTFHSAKIAKELAEALSERGYIIVSGLAMGIDKIAHEVIHNGYPTIAVMGTGVDNIYPFQHKDIYEKIAKSDSGLIITEMPLESPPKAYHFPMRNRIIAALARTGLIIQASAKSGSLGTAQFIIDSGDKELFVVPGFGGDERFGGSHQLLKSGAHLLTNANDVLELLEGYKGSVIRSEPISEVSNMIESIDSAKDIILSTLDDIPVFLEELQMHCNLDKNLFMRTIMELELDGKLKRNYDHTIYKII
ncbi:MAG: DNA-processing protein DprA [Anaplasmataceae bacterium]|nr:DNA-processing protein DprA [Anaplasmataceae bacterium]